MIERPERVATFLSEGEAKAIKAAAQSQGLSLSAFIRSAVLRAIADAK